MQLFSVRDALDDDLDGTLARVRATGFELVEPGDQLRPGAIYESNSFLIAAAVREAGGIPYRVGLVHDDEELVLATIEEQLVRADAVITTCTSQPALMKRRASSADL